MAFATCRERWSLYRCCSRFSTTWIPGRSLASFAQHSCTQKIHPQGRCLKPHLQALLLVAAGHRMPYWPAVAMLCPACLHAQTPQQEH